MFLGHSPVPHADLVIPRIGASITNYGLAVVRQFDLMGVPVLNNAIAIARSRDKLRAMQLLTKKDIDVPRTVCARTPESVDVALSFIGGTPAIVKLQQGAQGIGTMIAETPQAVTSLLETLWAMGQDIILQEYIAESKGRDYRAIVVGGRVVATMIGGRRRRASSAPTCIAAAPGVRVKMDKTVLGKRRSPRSRSWGSRSPASTCSRGATGRRSSRSTAPPVSRGSSAPAASTWPARSSSTPSASSSERKERRSRRDVVIEDERRHTRVPHARP